jgi:hypothetical protein
MVIFHSYVKLPEGNLYRRRLYKPLFGFVRKWATPFHPMLKIGIFSIKLAINDGVTPPFPNKKQITQKFQKTIKVITISLSTFLK